MTDIAVLWWSPTRGLFRSRNPRPDWFVNVLNADAEPDPENLDAWDELPADAVKLGDVEALALELHELRMAIAKVLDTKQPYVGWHSEEIGNILDRTRGGA